MSYNEIPGHEAGTHVGGILTTTAANEAAPELLRSEVDNRIMKIRPMATPVDQLGRRAATRAAGSMTVQYYAVDTRVAETSITSDVPAVTVEPDAESNAEVTLPVADNSAFEPTDTVIAVGSNMEDGTAPVYYIIDREGSNKLRALTVYGHRNGQGLMESPALRGGTILKRMGRAAGELDVQTPQFEALPRKSTNYCQIFKAQIEQSTAMRASNKEVGFSFSDQEEIAVYDMRLGMEKSFLFGRKARLFDPLKKNEVFLTGGIWHQAGREVTYPSDKITTAAWLEIMKTAFTGHGASARKILLAGSDLVEKLSLMDDGAQRVMLANDTVTHWGLDFHEMHSKFGTLLVILSEVMDQCGHSSDGLIIDPEYLTKYVHVPFNATVLDLRSSGQRNTDAVVMTEASCLVLRHPEAHVRVIPTKSR